MSNWSFCIQDELGVLGKKYGEQWWEIVIKPLSALIQVALGSNEGFLPGDCMGSICVHHSIAIRIL